MANCTYSSSSTTTPVANLINTAWFTITMIIMIISSSSSSVVVKSSHDEFAREMKVGKKVAEKMSHLHFYLQEVVRGEHPTSVTVAQANTTTSSATLFGLANVIDDVLTETPDLSSSKQVGRAQGMYISADTNTFGVCMVLNFVFTYGKYNGSTLSVLGRNETPRNVRELAIVGGTGLFRFATGYAQIKTYQFNQTTTGNANLEFDVFVNHY